MSTSSELLTPSPSSNESALGLDPFSYDADSDSSVERDTVNLPAPFFPPSLARKDSVCEDHHDDIIPRELPPYLGLPPVPTEIACKDIAAADIGTPDAWIPRDARLVRLTGRHPFNAEARLSDLYTQGFFTPSNLFFVRNHGAVPKVDQEKADGWQLRIHGLCANASTLSLTDLRRQFKVVTIPVTLVCAGNRRKEQNVVQQSLGFSWGAGGLSTALFTGVYLADVLDYIKPTRRAKHVVFEGCDELPNGPYGTSQILSWARDKRKGMMLAWAMNGVALEPDHGYPLRLVVPGQIGGRSVKWLHQIELSEIESQHHLHFHDNKVLPMPLNAERARAEKEWWYDPRYIIRDLNPNSAIAQPNHDEVLDTTLYPPGAIYTIKGYAYAGGGHRVTRVEISFSSSSSTTWNLANITYPEDAFRDLTHFDTVYGDFDKTNNNTDPSFCWSFWSFDVPMEELKDKEEIVVRCMDEGLGFQPRDMYWNATGMMNNWWFRVCIHQLGEGKIQFEHPTMAGMQPGGWMQRLKDKGMDPSKPHFSSAEVPSLPASAINVVKPTMKTEIVMTDPTVNRVISMSELQSKEAMKEAWFVVHGEVYNGSRFFNDHPGGASSIELAAGEDATEDFMNIHSVDAKKRLAEFHIGTLDAISEDVSKSTDSMDKGDPSVFLNKKVWRNAVLDSVREVSKNTKVFRFALAGMLEGQKLGLPCGMHVYLRLPSRRETDGQKDDEGGRRGGGEFVQRAYTPLAEFAGACADPKMIDFLIKIYHPSLEHPQGGLMSLAISDMFIGDRIELKGPLGHLTWKGAGWATLNGEDRKVSELGMVCGGTGVTPMLQMLQAIFFGASEEGPRSDEMTNVSLLDVNRTVEDIMCKKELDGMAERWKGSFRLHYSLTGQEPPRDLSSSYSKGRITDEMLKEYLPSPAEDRLVCICGPLGMEQAVKAALGRMGWEVAQIVIF